MTCRIVAPSARAEKLSAMRWRRIGCARAITSSIDGANRPSIRARARMASMKAWLARGLGPHATKFRTVSLDESSGRPERTNPSIACTTFSPTGRRRTRACAFSMMSGLITG